MAAAARRRNKNKNNADWPSGTLYFCFIKFNYARNTKHKAIFSLTGKQCHSQLITHKWNFCVNSIPKGSSLDGSSNYSGMLCCDCVLVLEACFSQIKDFNLAFLTIIFARNDSPIFTSISISISISIKKKNVLSSITS